MAVVATLQPMRVSNREEDLMNVEASMSGKQIVGLIIPPPDIRTIVDKTALFVARNGIDFENKIKERETSNPRFNFLLTTDPYYAYYKNKVTEFETGVTTAPEPKIRIPEAVREHIQKAEFVPRNPPRPFEFCADPSTINAFELDLIRLTALFVARNGRQFLTQLMNREVRNFQFDFLKPQHSNFGYFTKLVEQYTKIIIPPKNIIEDLRENNSFSKIMADVIYRVGWEKHQKQLRDRENAEVEQERLAYSQIDWHDFVVVQTVDFQPSETLNLPPLCTPKDVGTRILQQQRTEAAKAAAENVEMEMESDSDEEIEPVQVLNEKPRQISEMDDQRIQSKKHAAYEVTQPAPAAPSAGNVVISDYDPKRAKAGLKSVFTEKYIISPLTNERIPADKLHEHVRYNTVDPQYKEQRDREQMDRHDEDPTNASGNEISKNIAKLAERRTDIFGVGEKGAEQTIIGKKLGEEEKTVTRDSKIIWDGQQSTIEATTKAAQHAITIEQQIAEIHKQHGLIPDPTKERIGPIPTGLGGMLPPPSRPQMPQPQQIVSNIAGLKVLPNPNPPMMMAPPPGMQRPPFLPPGMPPMNAPNASLPSGGSSFMPPPPPSFAPDDGPPNKRTKQEESLEPESIWLQKISGSINIIIATPQTQEWNLEGKTFKFSLDISSSVTALKNSVQEKTSVPVSKLKLSYDGLFLKDNFTLAYYNFTNNAVIQLQLKERGGRKK